MISWLKILRSYNPYQGIDADAHGIIYSEASGRIVSFDLIEDKTLVKIEEGCDEYFHQVLNKHQFGQLIDELKELHEDMK